MTTQQDISEYKELVQNFKGRPATKLAKKIFAWVAFFVIITVASLIGMVIGLAFVLGVLQLINW